VTEHNKRNKTKNNNRPNSHKTIKRLHESENPFQTSIKRE